MEEEFTFRPKYVQVSNEKSISIDEYFSEEKMQELIEDYRAYYDLNDSLQERSGEHRSRETSFDSSSRIDRVSYEVNDSSQERGRGYKSRGISFDSRSHKEIDSGNNLDEATIRKSRDDLFKELNRVRIEISDYAETIEVGTEDSYVILKTKMGMNIVIPKGKIKKLRYKVHFRDPENSEKKIFTIDGIPKDEIIKKSITGKVGMTLSKTFKFIPIPGMQILGEAVDLSIDPWEFSIGHLRNVKIDFSESGVDPEWTFNGDGIENQLSVELSIKKPIECKKIVADIWAIWDVKLRFLDYFSELKNISDNEKTIQIWPVN